MIFCGLKLFCVTLGKTNRSTHRSDGGNSNSIYELDTLGNLIREISVIGASNVDWEGLSQNDEHIYIGDFGNNSGSRSDLCIYELDKAQIIDPNVTEIVAVKKSFVYSNNWS